MTQHEALYRQARPRTFSAVVGQGISVDAIVRAIVEDRLPQSILLSGHYGCGKTTIARLIAAALNCEYREAGSADPCGGSNPECVTCLGVLEGSAPLGAVTEMDAASNRSIDSVREMIKSMGYQVAAKRKVYIIDEAHQLSKDAATALLKTLEDTPVGVTIIMATTEPNKVDGPLLSRLTHYSLRAMEDSELESVVKDAAARFEIELSDGDLTAIIAGSNNSARNALNLLERYSQSDRRETSTMGPFLDGITEAVAETDAAAIILLINERITAGEDAPTILRTLTTHFRNAMVFHEAPGTLSASGEWLSAAEHAADRLDLKTILALTRALLNAARPNSPDARVALEVALLSVLRRPVAAQAAPGSETLTRRDLDDALAAFGETILAAVAAQPRVAVEAKDDRPLPWEERDEAPADLSDVAASIEAPLSVASVAAAEAKGEPTSDTGRAEFDADTFMDAMQKGVSRRGLMLLERYASLELDDKDDESVVLAVKGDRQLNEEDWKVVCDVITGLGWMLTERVLEERPA